MNIHSQTMDETFESGIEALAYLFDVDSTVIIGHFDSAEITEWWESKTADSLSKILEKWEFTSREEAYPAQDRARRMLPQLAQSDLGIREFDQKVGRFFLDIRPFLLDSIEVVEPVDLDSVSSYLCFSPPADLIRHLRDARQFARESTRNQFRFGNVVAAAFGAVQSALILTLGENAIKTRGRPDKRRVESFEQLFELAKEPRIWAEFDEASLPISTSWEKHTKGLRELRDSLEHPKFDGYHASPLLILDDCSGGLQYALFLVQHSPRIRRIFQSRHSELVQLLILTLAVIKAIDVREDGPFSIMDFGDQPEEINHQILQSLQKHGTIPVVSRFGIPEGIVIL